MVENHATTNEILFRTSEDLARLRDEFLAFRAHLHQTNAANLCVFTSMGWGVRETDTGWVLTPPPRRAWWRTDFGIDVLLCAAYCLMAALVVYALTTSGAM